MVLAPTTLPVFCRILPYSASHNIFPNSASHILPSSASLFYQSSAAILGFSGPRHIFYFL